ncbi:MAG TPA: cupin domain-containing protein [Gemmatimonadaceae bacterium]|jgi:quercetin dioxygenase-like cupin family protein|nr:cupin domain-containing protein [Gemmatimonadaceae bacterium]
MKTFVMIAAGATILALPAPAHAQQPVPGAEGIVPGNGVWYRVPTILPQGAQVTFVSGNPYLPEACTVDFRMPNKYTLPPHTNPAREHVTITSGTLRVGLGPKIDRKKSVVLVAGDTASTPAGVPHWSIAEGEVEIIVTWDSGPMGIAYMSRRDEPVGHSFPTGY